MDDKIKQQLTRLLVAHGLLKFGEFTLKSGAKSNHYVDLRQISMKPQVYDYACDNLVEYIKHNVIGCGDKHLISNPNIALVGIPYGVVPLAAVVAKAAGVIYYPVRKEIKNYGYKPDESTCDDYRFVLMEDVMSTGSSIIETIEKLPSKTITDVIVVVDREQGGRENIQKLYPNIEVHSILKISQILAIHEEALLVKD